MADQRLEGQRTLMRIFIGESDKVPHGPRRGHPVHHALLELFRERNLAGATVLRGIEGFGASGRRHTANLLDLSLDLPLVVEVVETEDRVQEVLPDIEAIIGGGLITLETVRVIVHPAHS